MGFGRDLKILRNGLTVMLGTLKTGFEHKSLADLALVAPVAGLRFTILGIKEVEEKDLVLHVLISSGQPSLGETLGISWTQSFFHMPGYLNILSKGRVQGHGVNEDYDILISDFLLY